MRKPLIAGNWKMHGSLSQAKSLSERIAHGASAYPNIDILVLPPFVHINLVKDLLTNTSVMWGAQNLYLGTQGAFTGEVSGSMLKELGCQYVLVGHSERRSVLHEDLNLVAAKFKAALDAGLKPILCIGETQAQRERKETEAILRQQLESVIQLAGIDAFSQAVIAYEPVWAIGTGLTATPEQAQSAHLFIRELIAKNKVDIAKTICILYGGSMKPDNAASLLAMPDIDGGLIGGASLDANSFLAICAAANIEV
jgi:triosephosphate isomerase